jgi:ribosomal 50S subunit-recycling heat shock protein
VGLLRLDKFLKVSRIIKRRTVAKEVCDNNRVKINDKPAKAGSEVSLGDIIEIRFGDKIVKFRVLIVKDHVSQSEAPELYESLP